MFACGKVIEPDVRCTKRSLARQQHVLSKSTVRFLPHSFTILLPRLNFFFKSSHTNTLCFIFSVKILIHELPFLHAVAIMLIYSGQSLAFLFRRNVFHSLCRHVSNIVRYLSLDLASVLFLFSF